MLKKTHLSNKNIRDLFRGLEPCQIDDPVLHQLADDSTNVLTYTFHRKQIEQLKTYFPENDFQKLLAEDFESEEISKLKFITLCVTAKFHGQMNSFEIFTICEISSQEKKNLYILPIKYLTNLDQLCLTLGIKAEKAFVSVRTPAIKAKKWTHLKIYSPNTHFEYQKIRQTIAEIACKICEPHEKIFVADLGSGLGDALDVTAQKLEEAKKTVVGIGIEQNQKNCEEARARFATKDYLFLNEDIRQLSQVMAPYRNHPFRLMIASGLLTRSVLENTFDALQVAQQIYRDSDAFITSGLTPVLLNERIAKKMGWQTYDTGSLENLYVFVKNKNALLPRVKNNQLDLSLHGNPAEVATLISNPLEVTELDLGLAYLQDFQTELPLILASFPHLQKVIVSRHEPWFKQLVEVAKEKELQIMECANLYLDTENHYANRWELKRFSRGFTSRLNDMLLFKKDLNNLINKIKENRERYASKSSILSSESEMVEYLNHLRHLAKNEEDDAALYLLAIKLRQGIFYECEDDQSKKNRPIDRFRSLKKSLFCFATLFKKGYPVLQGYTEVQQKLKEKRELKNYTKQYEALKY